jgi:chorismate--pyruvate lyase
MKYLRHALASSIHPAYPAWSTACQRLYANLPPFWRSWLTDSGSLSRRLESYRPGQFYVIVRHQGFGLATSLECRHLGLAYGNSVWVREVSLFLGDFKVVDARTAIPAPTLDGPLKKLKRLGTGSLGHYLFQQPDIVRTRLWVGKSRRCGIVERSVRPTCKPSNVRLEKPEAFKHRGVPEGQWVRHSVFRLRGKSLMVTEAFTAEFEALANAGFVSHTDAGLSQKD